MLVLGRRKGQRIQIGDNIILTIINTDQGLVKLGFEAPKEVIIDREEVVHKRKLNPEYSGKEK